MAIRIIPYEAAMEPAVVAFNRRLAAGGVAQRFSESHVPGWLPPAPGRSLFFEYFLAVEDATTVRGCYALKHQDYWVGRQRESIGFIALPISEGIVNRAFAATGAQLLFHAMRRQPLIYALGLGGENEAIARIVRAAGWRLSSVPFFFRVVRPAAFLRNIRALRRSPMRAAVLDAAAFSGLGWLAFRVLDAKRRLRRGAFPNVTAEIVAEFSDWSDVVWQACAADYGYCAVRDSPALRLLYPQSNARFLRVKISEAGRVIGWAVLLATDLRNHKHFGNMRLGSIVDAFARPHDAEKIVAAAERLLREKKVDLIVSNQSHGNWRQALRNRGFLSGPSNFLFATSKTLTERLDSLSIAADELYVNRGDGDGPINL